MFAGLFGGTRGEASRRDDLEPLGLDEPSPYRLRADFLSDTELSFYRVLESVVADRARICPKVNLGDVFFVSGGDQRQAQWNKISRKHIDFLLCSKATMGPLAGIELDDSSHNRSDRKERDTLVDSIFRQAGLPMIRVPARRNYTPSELNDLLAECLSGPVPELPTPETPPSTVDPLEAPAPSCPNCGAAMKLRVGKQGVHRGSQFYGCTNYPRCKGIVQVGSENRL